MSLEPRVTDALERAFEAGHSLIVRGVDRLVPDPRAWLRDGRSVGLGVLVALVGWLFLMHGAVDALAPHVPRFVVELGLGSAHAVAAAWLVLRGRTAAARREPCVGPRLAVLVADAEAAPRAADARGAALPPSAEGPLDWICAQAAASLTAATARGLAVARALRSGR